MKKILFAPFRWARFLILLIWHVLCAVTAIAGLIAGVPLKLVAIFAFYLCLSAAQGWDFAADIAKRGSGALKDRYKGD